MIFSSIIPAIVSSLAASSHWPENTLLLFHQEFAEICQQHDIITTIQKGRSKLQVQVLRMDGNFIVVSPRLGSGGGSAEIMISINDPNLDLRSALQEDGPCSTLGDVDDRLKAFGWFWRLKWKKASFADLDPKPTGPQQPTLDLDQPLTLTIPNLKQITDSANQVTESAPPISSAQIVSENSNLPSILPFQPGYRAHTLNYSLR